MNKSRPNKITFRLSDSEKIKFQALVEKSGYSAQIFLVRAIFGAKLIEKSSMIELIYELRKIGVNCNQIARACNSGNAPLEADRIKKLADTLEEKCQYLRQLM